MSKGELLSNLKREEGYKAFVYDDANGKPVVKGYTLIGNPTIGYGWNLAGKPLSNSRAGVILDWFVSDVYKEVFETFSWSFDLPDGPLTGLIDMAYNMGIPTLSTFKTFLSLLEAGKYEEAADDLKTTAWHKQVGKRAEDVEALIRQGNTPPDA